MDDLEFSSLLGGSLGHALGGASDTSLFVSPEQLSLPYGDFSLGMDDHSPGSAVTHWESTPESALVSSFTNTPLNMNDHLGSVDWSSAPLFFSSDNTAAGASRSSSSGSLPTAKEGKPAHRRTNSANVRKLIERSTANTKRRKTRDVSPIDLEAIKASGDKKEYKKKKNTEAARKSRAAKMERAQHMEEILASLEEENAEKDAEIERLKNILAAHGVSSV